MLWSRLRQLKAGNWTTQKLAAEKLGESKDVRAVDPLMAALKDEDWGVIGDDRVVAICPGHLHLILVTECID
jgi:HEAT repeat protein